MSNGRNGVREWIFQRFSNVAIMLFGVVYLVLFLTLDSYSYEAWVAMHTAAWFKAYASVTLLLVTGNSILAGWQIGTDYTQKVAIPGFAGLFHGFYFVVSLAYLAAGVYLIWLM